MGSSFHNGDDQDAQIQAAQNLRTKSALLRMRKPSGVVIFFPALFSRASIPLGRPWGPYVLIWADPPQVILHLISFFCSRAILLSFLQSDWLGPQVTP